MIVTPFFTSVSAPAFGACDRFVPRRSSPTTGPYRVRIAIKYGVHQGMPSHSLSTTPMRVCQPSPVAFN